MPNTYYVDDGGDGSDGLTWAKAYTSINALDSAVTFAAGDIVYFGHNMQCQASNSAHLTVTGPTSGLPVIFISATQGSDPPTYAQSTTKQIDTTEGAYNLIFDGGFSMYGLCMSSGGNITLSNDFDEHMYLDGCTFKPAANGTLQLTGIGGGKTVAKNIILDLVADESANSAIPFQMGNAGTLIVNGLEIRNATYRTGAIFTSNTGIMYIDSADVSGFTNATSCELVGISLQGISILSNCKTKSGIVYTTGNQTFGTCEVHIYNCGPTDDPSRLYVDVWQGVINSYNTINRTGGASIEGVSSSWLITTRAGCNENTPLHTPWIYGTIASTGSKTFTIYTVNDTADLTNAECWIEVQYLGTEDSPKTTPSTSQRATITTAAAANVSPCADDTTSTWVDNDGGISPSFTYKQSFAVTAVVGETGLFRARIVIGKASIAASSNFFIDPKVTVS